MSESTAFHCPRSFDEWRFGHYQHAPDAYHKSQRMVFCEASTNPMLPAFDAAADATRVHESLKEDKALMGVLAGRTNAQVQQIRKAYPQLHGGDLVEDVKKAQSGDFEKVLLALLEPNAAFDARILHEALSGVGTKESVLIEVLSSRTNDEILSLKRAYEDAYQHTLEHDIKKECWQDFKRALCSLCEGNRDESGDVDPERCAQDAKRLHAAGESRFGTEDSVFVEIITKRSAAQLLCISSEYEQVSEKTLAQAVGDETSGDYKKLLLALLDPVRYAAELLHGSVAGAGTDNKRLIRTLRSLHGRNARLHFVKKMYAQMYQQPLIRSVEGDTRGSYMQCLRRMAAATSADWRALLMREAMRGIGTSEGPLIEAVTLADSNNEQIALGHAYELDYGETAVRALKSELKTTPNFRDFLCGLMQDRAEFNAENMHHAMKGLGTKESALIDMLAGRSNREIRRMAEAFQTKYDKSLHDAIESETTLNFENVLVSLLRAVRHEDREENAEELAQNVSPVDIWEDPLDELVTEKQAEFFDAAKLAENLYKGGEGKMMGTNDDLFISVMTTHSPLQLREVSAAYQSAHGKTLEEAVLKETKGLVGTSNYCQTLLACIDPDTFAAECVHKACKGIGTNDHALIRLLAGRTTSQVQKVMAAYEKKYGEPMEKLIRGDTGGHYRKALLAHMGIPLAEQ